MIFDIIGLTYKIDVCKKYISISPEQIDERLAGTTFYISQKYDGELALLFWENDECTAYNTGGKARTDLPCIKEAEKLFRAAGLKSAMIPAELYKSQDKGHSRVNDTASALADKSQHDKLRLALFDIAHIDEEPYLEILQVEKKPFKSKNYNEIIEKLASICGDSQLVHPVRYVNVNSREQVKEIFAKWVNEEGCEGLIVRSELPMVYKLKNKYTLDAVITGFSEGTGDTKNQVRAFLLALMTEDGYFQVIGKCPASGIDIETRKKLYPKLLDLKVKSDYTEIDSNRVAFHAVRPEIVVEITINEAVFENNSGPVFDPLLEFKNNEYHRLRNVHGINLIHPVFSRFRDDKKVNAQDIRHSQIDEISCNPFWEGEEDEKSELEKSTLLKREVYKKTQGEKIMVQKFLVWKTNKDDASGTAYPAYVLAYTNFSSDRADALQSEVRISDSEEQIMSLYAAHIEKNIKKGWEKV